jgi:hypothetical protein
MLIACVVVLLQAQTQSGSSEPVHVSFYDQSKGAMSQFVMPEYGQAAGFRVNKGAAEDEAVILLRGPLPKRFSGRFIVDLHYREREGELGSKTVLVCLGTSVIYTADDKKVGPIAAALIDGGSQRYLSGVSFRVQGRREIKIRLPKALSGHELELALLRVVPPEVPRRRLVSLTEVATPLFQSEKTAGRSIVLPAIYDTGPP